MQNSDPRPDVSVLVPAFNEVENIPELVNSLCAMFDRHGLKGEIVLVDDGSTDGTYEAAENLARTEKRIKLLKHRANFGKTEAMLTGNSMMQICSIRRRKSRAFWIKSARAAAT